jgi:acyl carrier protein
MAVFERSDTKDKVISIIASELGRKSGEIQEDSTFNDIGADSLDMVEVIMKLEEQFGIEIKDEEAEHMKSVKDVVDFVNSHRTK